MSHPTLTLPTFRVFDKQDDPPHRHGVLASMVLPPATKVELVSNRTQTKWWVVATHGDYRAAKTLATTSERKAVEWLARIEEGNVEIAPLHLPGGLTPD